MIVFLGLILIDRFLVRIGVKWLLAMGFVILVLITGARQYAQSDYEQLLGGAQRV